jgi:hypothetical protein
MNKSFVIASDEGYWNNDIGWVENLNDATVFSHNATQYLQLPIGQNVRWEELSCNVMK